MSPPLRRCLFLCLLWLLLPLLALPAQAQQLGLPGLAGGGEAAEGRGGGGDDEGGARRDEVDEGALQRQHRVQVEVVVGLV